MYYYGCGFTQEIYPAVDFTAVPWRTDLLLPAPKLISPRPEAVICLDSAYGSGSNIFLEWSTVAGATHYIVQWAGNPQVSGPDVREAIVASPTTVYELVHGDDIRLGEEIYWRVFAINRTTGGASSKSEPRQLSFNCNSSEVGKGLNPCTDYDVQMTVNGAEYLSCCDENVYWLELSFACKDQFDRELIAVDSIEWSIKSNPDGPNAAAIKSELNGGFKVIVETHGETSQVIEVCVEVTFIDNVVGGTFTCGYCKKVFLDCDTPFTDRPWSPFFGTDQYNPLVAIHYDYLSYQPQGLMVNPQCGCDWTCSTVQPQSDLFSLGDLDVEVVVFETEICEGQAPVTVFRIIFDSIGSLDVEIYFTNLDGIETLATTLNLTGGTYPYDLQLYSPNPKVGRDCVSYIALRIVRIDTMEEHTTTATQIAQPFENCLSSDNYLVVATGPVFKIPITVCDGIETDCCDCVPERMSFTMGDFGLGTLTHDGTDWQSSDFFTAFECENFLGPSTLYCEGSTWVFQTFANCDDCNPVGAASCPDTCLPDSFPVSITAFSGLSQIYARSKTARNRPTYPVWNIPGEVKISPPCGGTIHLIDIVMIENFGGDSQIYFNFGADHLGWTLSSVSNLMVSCDPFSLSTNNVFTKGGCDDIEILFTITDVANCSPCSDSIFIEYSFEACPDPFDVSFSLYHENLPELIPIHIYDWVGRECSESRKTDIVALEARVNIPLDPCFFLVRDGMITLNLESLLGPGLGLGYRENGCPYIYSSGGGDCYSYHITYCCYTVYSIPTYSGGGASSFFNPPLMYEYSSFNYSFNYEFD